MITLNDSRRNSFGKYCKHLVLKTHFTFSTSSTTSFIMVLVVTHLCYKTTGFKLAILTEFSLMLYFYTSLKVLGFPTFSRGAEIEHWDEIG